MESHTVFCLFNRFSITFFYCLLTLDREPAGQARKRDHKCTKKSIEEIDDFLNLHFLARNTKHMTIAQSAIKHICDMCVMHRIEWEMNFKNVTTTIMKM